MRRLFPVDLGASWSILLFPALEPSAVCSGESLSAWCGPIRLEADAGWGASAAAAEAAGLCEFEYGALRGDLRFLRVILDDALRGESEEVASMSPDAAARLAARALLSLSMPSSARRLSLSCSSLWSLTKPSKNVTRLSNDMQRAY
jgi:hypothetical protein